jgi:hypothetical protein
MREGNADIGRDSGLAVTAFCSSFLRSLSLSNVAFSPDSVFFCVPRVCCTAGEMHQSRQPAVVVYRHWHFAVLLGCSRWSSCRRCAYFLLLFSSRVHTGLVSFLVSISFSNALSCCNCSHRRHVVLAASHCGVWSAFCDPSQLSSHQVAFSLLLHNAHAPSTRM